MAFYNGVYETSVTTGTGTYTLAGAFIASGATVSAYQTFAIVGNGNQCYYRAQDNENGGWEYGVGTYTASGTTLARTTVLGSSNANAAVSWVAGTRQIFLIEPAEALATLNVYNLGPNASAIFELISTTQGILPPRMTTTQKNAISSPAEGLVVHDSTLHAPYYYNGSAWTTYGLVTPVTVANGGTGLATLTAHALYAGNGTSAPQSVGPGSTDGVPLVATGSSTDPAFRSTSLKFDSTFGAITVDADAAPVAINWATSNWHSTTLTASRTITFTGDVDGGAITIIFKSGGTGAFTPVWPATVKWFGGAVPVLTNVAGHWDLVSIKRESSGNYIGTFSPNYF